MKYIQKKISFYCILSYFLFGINIFCMLYPVQLISNQVQYHQYLLWLTNYINPIIVTFSILFYLLSGERIKKNNILYSATVYATVCIISSILGGDPIKNISIALFFMLSVLLIFNVYESTYLKYQINIYLIIILAVFNIIPIILLLDTSSRIYFINEGENSFHGFFSGRIEYGLWTSIAMVSIFAYRYKLNKFIVLILLISMAFGLYLSQSRSAFAGIFLAIIFYKLTALRKISSKLISLSISSLLLISILLSWEYFGRQNIFEVVNSTRYDIYTYYINSITINNFIFGNGEQFSLILSYGNGEETQAHNLILQYLLNWGIFGLISLMFFLYSFWSCLVSINSKLLFIVFFFFSLTQPIQGTANFFGPVTFCYFLITIGIEVDNFLNKIKQKNVLAI